jgi:hypothetical protein
MLLQTQPAETGRRQARDDDVADAGPANLIVTPRRWVAFDWVNIPVPHNPDLVEHVQAEFANWVWPPALFKPDLGVQLALRRLPPPFRDVSCLWQVTASAGFKEGFRLRTWHWLSQALTGAQLKCWLNPAIERGLVDPSTLVEVQPHYVCCTVRGGPDPCQQRFGLLKRTASTVAVPEIENIKMRQERRSRSRRRTDSGKQTVTVDAVTGTTSDVDRRIGECVAAVRRARSGSRHPTFKSELARARALCDRHGEPADLFEHVAKRWSLTLGTRVSPAQVVLCLIDLKLARLAHDPRHFDSITDIAGYAGCLAEVLSDA